MRARVVGELIGTFCKLEGESTYLRCLLVEMVVGPQSDILGWRSLGSVAVR